MIVDSLPATWDDDEADEDEDEYDGATDYIDLMMRCEGCERHVGASRICDECGYCPRCCVCEDWEPVEEE